MFESKVDDTRLSCSANKSRFRSALAGCSTTSINCSLNLAKCEHKSGSELLWTRLSSPGIVMCFRVSAAVSLRLFASTTPTEALSVGLLVIFISAPRS